MTNPNNDMSTEKTTKAPAIRADKTIENLEGNIKQTIRQHGPLSLADYMSTCLMDPQFGYYQQADVFGPKGDFITAPEISQIFGELLGLWAGVVWQNMGSPKSFNLVELGPGRGTLMADALRALKILPGALDACDVHLIELSTRLRHLQKNNLPSLHDRLHWHDDTSTLPNAPTIILANEFLDALPIRQFVKFNGRWHENIIGLNEKNEIVLQLDKTDTKIDIDLDVLAGAKEGDIFETRNIPRSFMPTLNMAGDYPLAALFIDYGHVQTSFGDTFQAIQNHAYCDPLASPGTADLTAHVDFEAFGNIMRDRNYVVYEVASQSEFLGALGIIERAQRLMQTASMTERNKIENQIARLISPDAMGARFKVLGLTSPGIAPLPGLNVKAITI